MFESLGKIQNPVARSLTAALTTVSVVAVASAIALGFTKSKDESAHQAAVYSALAAGGCGALFGLVCTSPGKSSAAANKPDTSSATSTWTNWRNFVVVRKVKESEEITSFYLQPEDQGEIPNFQPGQFLTIQLNIPGQARPVIRTYSLSDYRQPCDYYRLSIKREPAPAGLDVMPGIASNFMHDQIQEGSVIPAKPPSGRFFLDVQKSTPAVLISNGVGITPMISMAKAVAILNPSRPVWFLHGARDGRFHAFRDEVKAIAHPAADQGEQPPNLYLHFAYSRPREEDRDHHHSVGYVDTVLVQSLMLQDAEYFLCGSPPFLAAIREGLQQAGVPESRVFFEMFTKASKTPSDRSAVASSPEGMGSVEIVFAQSNTTASWTGEADSLLEFAEANDLNPDYSCRVGVCGTCQCKLLEGEVEYQEPPTATVESGSVLICISKPKTARVVLDL